MIFFVWNKKLISMFIFLAATISTTGLPFDLFKAKQYWIKELLKIKCKLIFNLQQNPFGFELF